MNLYVSYTKQAVSPDKQLAGVSRQVWHSIVQFYNDDFIAYFFYALPGYDDMLAVCPHAYEGVLPGQDYGLYFPGMNIYDHISIADNT
jgi:hypothetical protein